MRIPPSILYQGSSAGTHAGVDPFAPSDGQPPVNTTQEILAKALGIEFPPGTYARYDPRTGTLAVRHHPAVMKAIQYYMETLAGSPELMLLVQVEVYQMPLNLALRFLRESVSGNSDGAIWEKIRRAAEDENDPVEAVTALYLHARSGRRAKTEDKSEFIYPTEIEWNESKQAIIPGAFETRDVGSMLEVDPVIGADQVTIDLNFEFEHHTAPPTMHPITIASPDQNAKLTVVEMPEFHSKRVNTQITMRAGGTKLIGTWRPTGKPEYEKSKLMHLVFLRTALQKVQAVSTDEAR